MFTSRSSMILTLGIVILGTIIMEAGGKRRMVMRGRVTARSGTFKFMVAIYRGKTTETYGWLIGGGAIISENYIVTSAGCVHVYDSAKLVVVTAIRDSHTPDGEIRAIQKITEHSDYTGGAIPKNDIALILLREPLNFTPRSLQPLYFPDYTRRIGKNWVLLSPQETIDTNPLAVSRLEPAMVNRHKCGISGLHKYRFAYICAQNTRTKMGEYDIGSPLVQSIYIIGVVSNHTSGIATIFTNVSFHKAWIDEVMLNQS